MAINPARRWIKKDLAARQQIIRDFYITGDPKVAASFMKLIKAPKGFGIFASIGPRIQYAIYGRDSVEVAEDLLPTRSWCVKSSLSWRTCKACTTTTALKKSQAKSTTNTAATISKAGAFHAWRKR